MNKEEYLHELEACLKKHLSRSEVEDILRDYGEYFEDGRRQNKTDMEISAKLGAPALIAGQFIEEGSPHREKSGEELEQLREKTVQGFRSVGRKLQDAVSGVHPLRWIGSIFSYFIKFLGRGFHGFGKAVSGSLQKCFPTFGSIFRWLWKGMLWIVKGLELLCRTGVRLFLFGMGLLVLSGLLLFFLISGLGVLFATIVTMDLFSSYFTVAGFFYTVFGLSASALCVMAALGILKRGLHRTERLANSIKGQEKQVNQEGQAEQEGQAGEESTRKEHVYG